MIYLLILIPLFSAVLSLLAWRWLRAQKVLSLLGTLALLGVTIVLFLQVQREGILSTSAGNWPAPFGISLVVDGFSAIMLLVAALAGLAAAIYSLAGIDTNRARWGYYPLFHFLLMGVNGAFSTGDLFNLYVWFEVMLMSSFVLMVLGGERRQLEGGLKYVILNLLSSMLFLSAIGLTYHVSGTLNLADLALRMAQIQPQGIDLLIALLFLVGFGIKAALFPLFFWLPASYHTPPVVISALFSGLLTKVGFYAMTRIFSLLFAASPSAWSFLQPVLLVIAGLTMLTGVLGAASQMDFRRLLSFHIISQIGYLVMGLALFTREALGAAIYFTAHVILAKMALFLVAGMVNRAAGSFDLRRLGGLYRRAPGLSLAFLVPALALAGLPPLSGFFAKLALILASLRLEQYAITIVALVVSLLTLFSMTKIWNEAFWKPVEAPTPARNAPVRLPTAMWIAVLGLAAMGVLMGILAGPLLELANQAAAGLLQPQEYIQAVLGLPGGLP